MFQEEDDVDAPKQAKRNDIYSLCRRFGLMGIAGRFGLTPTEFGENLKDGYQKIDVRQVRPLTQFFSVPFLVKKTH